MNERQRRESATSATQERDPGEHAGERAEVYTLKRSESRRAAPQRLTRHEFPLRRSTSTSVKLSWTANTRPEGCTQKPPSP